jgi:hypothetical protein
LDLESKLRVELEHKHTEELELKKKHAAQIEASRLKIIKDEADTKQKNADAKALTLKK